MSKRTAYLLILFFIIIPLLILTSAIKKRSEKPNVVLIILDAARADHFSCYGYNRPTTPNIDRIARGGALFLNHFSGGAYTKTAIPNLFSSRYVTIDNILDSDAAMWKAEKKSPASIFQIFDARQIFLPDVLSSHDYNTIVSARHPWFGKNCFLMKRFNFRFFDKFDYNNLNTDSDIISNRNSINRTCSLLERSKKKPFFFYWHILAPHVPYLYQGKEANLFNAPSQEVLNSLNKKIKSKKISQIYAKYLTKEEIGIIRDLYDSKLRYADRLVGMLYERFREAGLLNNTIFIITADHGENLGEHGYLLHDPYTYYDSILHVPLVISFPGAIPPNVRINGFSESVDIMPTILDYCHIRLPYGKSMDGVSLRRMVRHPGEGKKEVFARQHIRTSGYKYFITEKGGFLYNLKEDPFETVNIYDRELKTREELSAKLNRRLEPYLKRFQKSIRTTQPDYPFRYPVNVFSILPEEAVQQVKKYDIATTIKKNLANKPWLVKGDELVPFYGKRHLPITLASALPDGAYTVSLLLQSQHVLRDIKETGLLYRFSREDAFIFPYQLKFFSTPYKNNFYYYVYLGKAIVKNKTFTLELDFNATDDSLYSIHHIKFVPAGYNDSRKEVSGKRFRQEIENLKSLGYLQ